MDIKLEKFNKWLTFFIFPIYIFCEEMGNTLLGYALIFVALFAGLINFVHKKNHGIEYNKADNFISQKAFLVSIAICLFYLIQMVINVAINKHNGILHYGIYDLIFMTIPLMWFYFVSPQFSKKDIIILCYDIFISSVIALAIFQREMFTWDNLKDLSLFDSSSNYENNCALRFMLCFIIFLYNKKYFMSVLSFIVCALCFKRTELFLMIFFLVIYILSLFDRKNRLYKNVGYKSKLLILFIFVGITILYTQILKDLSFDRWFENQYGVSLTKFTSGRNDILRSVFFSSFDLKGLGAGDYILTDILGRTEIRFLHCDLVKFYMETGLIGLVLFIIMNLVLCKNKIQLLIIISILFTMITTHRLTDFNGKMMMFIVLSNFSSSYLFNKNNDAVIGELQ